MAAFGEVILRLASPDRRTIVQAQSFGVEVGGAEANVLAGLSALDHDVVLISALPSNSLGDLAAAGLRARNIDLSHVARAEGRMGLYFLEPGQGWRPSRITYDRAGSAFAELDWHNFDFKSAVQGADILHISGITPALGRKSFDAVGALLDAADAVGVPISFDCNYRQKLWSTWNENPRALLEQIISKAEILFGNHRDIAMLLEIEIAGEGVERRRAAAEVAFDHFPRLQILASTGREVVAADHNHLAARIDTRTRCAQTEPIDIAGIVDRIGTGDAFAAGVLHSHLEGDSSETMASTGLALAALKHSLPGDMSTFDRQQLDHFCSGGRDILR
ncbi:2-dehydro-3-deoxygluconate kinase [Pacificimonas flava]|uniref:2-dehydro-3-deoxygluconate kinase n=1 Tax=Pacificimonas flava TaxID=1234595 RepID=M2TD49_9SPHN|nr:2-dehydro-3-deoxygluconate kinase [Pacificimonas flava]